MKENTVYCDECGEDESLAFVDQFASGDYWRCKTCGHEFHYTVKEDE